MPVNPKIEMEMKGQPKRNVLEKLHKKQAKLLVESCQ